MAEKHSSLQRLGDILGIEVFHLPGAKDIWRKLLENEDKANGRRTYMRH